jgi:hypothetical protein
MTYQAIDTFFPPSQAGSPAIRRESAIVPKGVSDQARVSRVIGVLQKLVPERSKEWHQHIKFRG